MISSKILYHKNNKIDPAYFITHSKINTLKNELLDSSVSTVIFDNELSPAQHKNIEKELEVKVIDRTQLILDIFALHANTRESKIQVELAQLNYLLPRLKGKGSQMSRLAGGIGTRGPGESKLEVDRRRIEKKIHRLKQKMKNVQKVRENQRKNRTDPLIVLVGYTNAGKSTLMNLLTEANTEVADKLFATLDSTLRSMTLPVGKKVILSDTVGFINRLPHQLVASFKSTLEEVKNAQLLLHVIDISQQEIEKKIKVVNNVLSDINADHKKTVNIFNKSDLVSREKINKIQTLFPDSMVISAQNSQSRDKIIQKLNSIIKDSMNQVEINLPYQKAHLVEQIYNEGSVFKEKYLKNYIFIKALVSKKMADILSPYRLKN